MSLCPRPLHCTPLVKPFPYFLVSELERSLDVCSSQWYNSQPHISFLTQGPLLLAILPAWVPGSQQDAHEFLSCFSPTYPVSKGPLYPAR